MSLHDDQTRDDQARDEILEVETEEVDGRTVVRVAGEIDPSTSELLDAALEPHAADAALVLDLSGVSFIDSSGLRVLIAASKHRGDRLTLRAPSPTVSRLLDLTGIADRFTVVDA